jgi:septal ring factor EnvC (AmiA/AmiB activator)
MEKTSNANGTAYIDIQTQLNGIVRFLQTEYTEKKIEVRKQEAAMEILKNILQEKDGEINSVKESLQQAQEAAEGNRQLVNKLLGEISKLQNDIEWYKRTYETRSFLGTILEKIKRKINN